MFQNVPQIVQSFSICYEFLVHKHNAKLQVDEIQQRVGNLFMLDFTSLQLLVQMRCGFMYILIARMTKLYPAWCQIDIRRYSPIRCTSHARCFSGLNDKSAAADGILNKILCISRMKITDNARH